MTKKVYKFDRKGRRWMILLFTTPKYHSFNPPYFPKRTLKFFFNSIRTCCALKWVKSKRNLLTILSLACLYQLPFLKGADQPTPNFLTFRINISTFLLVKAIFMFFVFFCKKIGCQKYFRHQIS